MQSKEKTKCVECGKETKELFEKVSSKGISWVCKKCRPSGYNTRGREVKRRSSYSNAK